jgi:hypothetical protein
MRSILATQRSHKPAPRPIGIVKNADPKKHVKHLRSLDKYFWYTASDGVSRLATSSSSLNEVPKQVNDYIFDTSLFPPDTPRTATVLLQAVGPEGSRCVGNTCYTSTACRNLHCTHSLSAFKSSTLDWQDHFELRKTDDRGIGAYTTRAFKKGDLLGWYAGEILPASHSKNSSDYLMEMPIGSELYISSPTNVLIDAAHVGNWTRFINHSCDPYCDFRMRRVGDVRIMTVEALRGVPEGAEVTVDYGDEYYGVDTARRCYCGVEGCVSESRVEKEIWAKKDGRKVKRCSRLTPPVE